MKANGSLLDCVNDYTVPHSGKKLNMWREAREMS